VSVDFKLEDRKLRSGVMVFFTESSLERIDQALDRFLDALAAS
jgi:hypothetical protein